MISKISREPGLGQESLFADPHEVALQPENGVSVSVHERAQHLVYTLDLLGRAGQRAGLQLAAESPHLTELEERYGSELPKIVQGAATNETRFMNDAKWQFAWAGGYITLKHSGLVEADAATTIAQDDFRTFLATYAGTENRKDRDAFRRSLKRNNKIT